MQESLQTCNDLIGAVASSAIGKLMELDGILWQGYTCILYTFNNAESVLCNNEEKEVFCVYILD